MIIELNQVLSFMLTSLLNIILPNTCHLCLAPTGNTLSLCHTCKNRIITPKNPCQRCARPLPHHAMPFALCGQCLYQQPHFDNTIALSLYHSPIKEMIIDLKFNGKHLNAKLLSYLFCNKLKQYNQFHIPNALISVPLHYKRLQQRGYNQSYQLARHIAKSLNIPLLPNVIKRSKNTLPQTQLSLVQRKKNVQNAFTCHRLTPYPHIAIVDDVMTTGNTLNSMSHLLKKSGVSTIDAWIMARALPQ